MVSYRLTAMVSVLFLLLSSCRLMDSLETNSVKVEMALDQIHKALAKSDGALGKAGDIAGAVADVITDVRDKYDNIKPMVEETLSAAKGTYKEIAKDHDGDGDVDLNDLLIWLGGTLGVGGLGVTARNLASGRKKKKVEAELRSETAELRAAIAAIAGKAAITGKPS